MCVNIGDQFARSKYYGRYKVIPIRTEIIRFCETLGMDYMGAIIWQKTTTMNTSGGGAVMGSFPYPRNGILKMDYEFILIFKKQGKAPKPTKEQKENSAMTKEEWKEYFSSHWYFGGVKQLEHIAMFPEELPKRLIKMFSFAEETVFDPFAGSGTTLLAARNLGRNSVGYEINGDFRQIISDKLSGDVLFEEDLCQTYDIESLPYIFHDPHKMDKKVDLKENQYGSKLDDSPAKKEELYRVKRIISPEKIEINDGRIIRLIGIKENPRYSDMAVEFLKQKFKNRKIFLKYDTASQDKAGLPLCYVYLDNKTFINNHLIRTGFVEVDLETEYKYRDKFMKNAGNPPPL